MSESSNSIFAENITVEECRQAILNAPGFRETVKGDYRLFNYDYAFSGSFPDPNLAPTPLEKRLLQIRRCVPFDPFLHKPRVFRVGFGSTAVQPSTM